MTRFPSAASAIHRSTSTGWVMSRCRNSKSSSGSDRANRTSGSRSSVVRGRKTMVRHLSSKCMGKSCLCLAGDAMACPAGIRDIPHETSHAVPVPAITRVIQLRRIRLRGGSGSGVCPHFQVHSSGVDLHGSAYCTLNTYRPIRRQTRRNRFRAQELHTLGFRRSHFALADACRVTGRHVNRGRRVDRHGHLQAGSLPRRASSR